MQWSRHFGIPIPSEPHGIHRHTFLNIGPLDIGSAPCDKTNSMCEMIRKHDIDSLGICEHGLNVPKIKKHAQWKEPMLGQLENDRSKIAWNSWEKLTDK